MCPALASLELFPGHAPQLGIVSNAKGVANADGTMTQRANLGERPDPEGVFGLSANGSAFTFATYDSATIKSHFGCCSFYSTMTVDVTTGKHTVASLARHGTGPHSSPVTGVKCGLHGCGFLEIGAVDPAARTAIGWVEALIPNPHGHTAHSGGSVAGGDNDIGRHSGGSVVEARQSSTYRHRRRAAEHQKPGNVLGEALVRYVPCTCRPQTSRI